MVNRRRRFAQVSDLLAIDPRISANAVRVYLRLDRYAGSDGNAFPSIDRLAADVHMSRSGVDRAIRELRDAGWIVRTRRGTSNIIDTELLDAPGSVTCGVSPGQNGNVTGGVSTGGDVPGNVTGDVSGTSPVTRLLSDTQFKERGGVGDLVITPPGAVATPARMNDEEEQLPVVVPVLPTDRCDEHAGTDSDAPCRACGIARRAYAASVDANARSRAARSRALELRGHARLVAERREADRGAVDMSGGRLRAAVRAAMASRAASEAS